MMGGRQGGEEEFAEFNVAGSVGDLRISPL